jgi:molybdopterin synthase catalytic subunit
MHIQVRLFARLRELAGWEARTLEVPEGSTVGGVLDQLAQQQPELGAVRGVLQAAINREHAPGTRALAEGDELAVFPPLSGGEGDEVWLGRDPILDQDHPPLEGGGETGARVRFLGTVRGSFEGRPVLRLAYEAYEPMALEELERVAAEARTRFKLHAVRVRHRLGELEVGETALRVSVDASHRQEAFAACAWIVDSIKERLPIWKKELLADGERWV